MNFRLLPRSFSRQCITNGLYRRSPTEVEDCLIMVVIVKTVIILLIGNRRNGSNSKKRNTGNNSQNHSTNSSTDSCNKDHNSTHSHSSNVTICSSCSTGNNDKNGWRIVIVTTIGNITSNNSRSEHRNNNSHSDGNDSRSRHRTPLERNSQEEGHPLRVKEKLVFRGCRLVSPLPF